MSRAAINQSAYQSGRDHYEAVGYREAPLSGEWAGESMGELSTQYGIDLSDCEVADCFEDGFWSAAYDERMDKGGV